MKICNLLILIIALAGIISGCQPAEKADTNKPPNIIFILTDDLGYGDLGILYQNQRARENKFAHKTPNLDKLAGEGTLLTRHYVPAPVCAPSRASLLLGVHQGHANVRNNQFDKALEDNYTIASVLKEAGYTTGIVGKYGLQGKEGNSPETWPAYPTKRGFDFFFGYVRHVDGHNHYPAHEALKRPPMELYYGDREISSQLKGVYTTDLFTAAAKKWITDVNKADPERPFFLYLAYNTPHAGLQVAPVPYPEGGGLNGGVQWIGEEGNFINAIGDTIDNYIHPDYDNNDWPEVQKRFSSMVRRIDNAVADVEQLLYDLNIAENTLIVFSSDNGPHHESYGYGDYQPTFFDSFGEMDGVKRDTWEGGIRVPTFVWWPGKITPGKLNDIPSQFHDWLPTFAEAAGIMPPARTDGVSLLPQLFGNEKID
ncbi:MAG: sulfatase-like hydrolase/transferase, partial [Cyclobacteriaceae bacterium]